MILHRVNIYDSIKVVNDNDNKVINIYDNTKMVNINDNIKVVNTNEQR